MTRKFPYYLFLVFLTSFPILLAQSNSGQDVRMKLPDPNFHPPTIENSISPGVLTGVGDQMIITGYDYETNNATRRMIDLVDLDSDGSPDPIVVAMKRDVENGDRFIMLAFKAFGVIDAFNAFDPAQTPFGWPEVQYLVGGPNDGQALVMGHVGGTAWHSWIDLVNFEPLLPYPTTTFGGNWPSFVYLGSVAGAILGITTDMIIYLSVDGGASFNPMLTVGDGDPNIDMSIATDTPAEIPLRKSNNDMVIATFGGYDGIALSGNPDIIYWYGSADAGATWGGQIWGRGSGINPEYGQVANRNYAPYFTNFSQVGHDIDPTGTTHALVNGYGEGFYMGGTDPVSVYPMLYKNSNLSQWIPVTSEEMEAPDDGFGNTIVDNYPGNGIGNAYGTIATSNNGQVVFVMWQGPEWTGTIGSSPYNIYPGDGGGNTGPAYYTDIYYNVSYDGGQTWSGAGIIQGDPGVQESYPVLAADLEIAGNQATAHYIYYIDPIPGTSLFAGGNSFDPNGAWYHNTYTWTDPQIPVELGSYSSMVNDGEVTLLWNTVTETNNSGFEVKRNDEKIGFVEGSGTSTKIHNYTFTDNIVETGNYEYKIIQVDYDGTKDLLFKLMINVDLTPSEFSLLQNYPNPFNPSTKIKFTVAEKSFVKLKVYSVLGQEIKTLVKEEKSPGKYSVDFDAGDLPSGTYIYTIQAGNFSSSKKMILLR